MSALSIPPWFHPQGLKMVLDVEKSVAGLRIVLSASAAFLHIMRDYCEGRRGPSSPAERKSFSIQWEIRHSAHEITIGTRVVSEDDLRGMFGLSLPHPRNAASEQTGVQWARERIHATDALYALYDQITGRPGYFLRADDFLNVPGPGIGKDGDPNISIEIDVAMREAVLALIEHNP